MSIDYRHRTLYAAVDYHQYALINDGTIEIYAYGKRDERGAAPFGSPGGSSNVNLDECKLTNVFDILPDGTIIESDIIVDEEDILLHRAGDKNRENQLERHISRRSV